MVALVMALRAAVPVWIETVRRYDAEKLEERAQECLVFMQANPEYHLHFQPTLAEPIMAASFAILAEALAIASFAVGGVVYAGCHWESR